MQLILNFLGLDTSWSSCALLFGWCRIRQLLPRGSSFEPDSFSSWSVARMELIAGTSSKDPNIRILLPYVETCIFAMVHSKLSKCCYEVQRGSEAATVWVQRRLGAAVHWRRRGTAAEGSSREQNQQVRGGNRGSEAEMSSIQLPLIMIQT